MLSLHVEPTSPIHNLLSDRHNPDLPLTTSSPEERVKLLVLRDLLRLGWEVSFCSEKVTITPPAAYDKNVIRSSMQMRRTEIIHQRRDWISDHLELARTNIASGKMAWKSRIKPIIEVCKTKEQFDLFRICRFYWSSPYSEYVGRRIKLLVRDAGLPSRPLIGIAALGSSIVHIPERDQWIGWNTASRTKNLVYTMDAYVTGALPPYSYLLGGKLVSYILASNEVRTIFRQKYRGQLTNISKRKANQLACIFTTSLYGRSSQYNRLKFNDRLLYIPIGKTKGYGTLHLTNEAFDAMRDFLKSKNVLVTNRFGDGPIWRMRVMRTASELLGIDPDFLLRHSFQRNIYAIPLATNFKEFLKDEQKKIEYFNYPMTKLVAHWKTRWFAQRRKQPDVRKSVIAFQPENFTID